jgi:2-polyprenyl-3-methyl-5-hydroxy-6-metoxy-1,4-benzoquinol methylase
VSETPPRPFYSTYAWAFNLLIDRPVRKECATIAAWLVERGVRPGAVLLDAGCGTGRYAGEMARRGYVVHGIDASPDMIDVARRSVAGSPLPVTFEAGDFLAASDRRFDAILCRGVLNEFEEDCDRAAVFIAFARALRSGGVLIMDVRDWDASVERKTREPLFRKSVDTEHGRLEFSALTRVDPERHRLLITERHTLIADGSERSADAEFVMRCWTRQELDTALAANGFEPASYFGAYDPAIGVGATDRLVLVTSHRRAMTDDR